MTRGARVSVLDGSSLGSPPGLEVDDASSASEEETLEHRVILWGDVFLASGSHPCLARGASDSGM